MSRSSRRKIDDAPKFGLKWGDEVQWTYDHSLGTAYTRITKTGKFLGCVLHTRRYLMNGGVPKGHVHFKGNYSRSKVPLSELVKI